MKIRTSNERLSERYSVLQLGLSIKDLVLSSRRFLPLHINMITRTMQGGSTYKRYLFLQRTSYI